MQTRLLKLTGSQLRVRAMDDDIEKAIRRADRAIQAADAFVLISLGTVAALAAAGLAVIAWSYL
jgi:hypothetical protein